MLEESRILGIDPGTNIMGYGIIQVHGKKLVYVKHGVYRFDTRTESVIRLKAIYNATKELIEIYQPKSLAVEAPFFGKNVQSMLKLGRAQGVVLAAALSLDLEVQEYAPRKIKQSITGKGNASKEQVAAMLDHILVLPPSESISLDATDALSVAVCHYLQGSANISNLPKPILKKNQKKASNWTQFLDRNPDRINQ